MDRLGFLKRLGLGVSAAVVAPTVLAQDKAYKEGKFGGNEYVYHNNNVFWKKEDTMLISTGIAMSLEEIKESNARLRRTLNEN